DAIGRRVSRTAGGTTTTFQYGGGGVLLEKQGATTTATYTYGNALLRKDGEYPLFDGLGSERTVTNSSQTVTGTLTLDGFGQTVTSTGSSANPYMFGATSGYRTEGDAGLMKVGARYYDAQVGRFLTRDTYLDQHPYLYCNHDPINFVDPDGHWRITGAVIGGFIGSVVGGIIGGMIGGAPGAVWGARLGGFVGGLVGAHWGDHKDWPSSIGNGLIGAIGGPIGSGLGGRIGFILFGRRIFAYMPWMDTYFARMVLLGGINGTIRKL
ncbi:MAG TPA: RHS repeat-associated core domain-containing protein, partial [Chthonomonadaceae bacterium]|nr:RHS repeat-associated core domain-containing protein [Chthonomonadaceae bacterium]